jgi:creatinine amidohydrolase
VSGAHYDLGDLSYTRVEELLEAHDRKVAVIPTGSVEAHGPHLPLSTDTLISDEVAKLSAQMLAEQGYLAVRFPPLAYGVTDWARSFRGTASISTEVIHGLVLEACLAAVEIGFDRVVLTNAHLEPGHIQTLRGVAKEFETKAGQPLLFVDKTRRKQAQKLTEEFQSGSCHAGQYETSLVLAIRPDLVDLATARALPEHVVALHEKIAAGAKDFAECGLDQAYCGNPAGATADEGRQSLQALSQMVVDAVDSSYA